MQRGRKIDTEKFLYKIEKGIVDTDMVVGPLIGVTTTQGDGTETIGTLELRLYVTRQLDVSHSLGDIKKYSNAGGNIEDDDAQLAIYRQIHPSFLMRFDQNSELLIKAKNSREQTRLDAKRPGTEPWAIFRFHYRSEGQ